MDNIIFNLILLSSLPLYFTIILFVMFSFIFLPYILFKKDLYKQSIHSFFNSVSKTFFIPISCLINFICLILSPQIFIQKWLINISLMMEITKNIGISVYQNYMVYGLFWILLIILILSTKITKTK